MMSMNREDYEWDESKRISNLDKHGIDFTDIHRFEWNTAVVNSNRRHGELRFVATGYIAARLHVVVYTMRASRKRVISLRVASNRERASYAQT